MSPSTNEIKNQTKNPVLRFALSRFLSSVLTMMPKVDNVVDAGCGEGYAAKAIQQHVPDVKFYGFDLSALALEKARQIHPRMETASADITRLPITSKCADLVIALEVLEHIPNPAAAVRELKRISRRYVLISTPNEPLFRGLRMLRGDNIRQWGNHPEHVNHWNLFTLQQFVAGQGLTVIKASCPPPFIWTIVLAETSS
jgi:SAM-dependent methyltransferase